MNKKNLGLIALFILLIAAVVLLTAGETREEDAPLPDIRLTEIVPHSTQINADGYAMGSITLTSFADAPADLAGWGLADRVYKVKYVFERGTTLAPGESLTVYLAGKPQTRRILGNSLAKCSSECLWPYLAVHHSAWKA